MGLLGRHSAWNNGELERNQFGLCIVYKKKECGVWVCWWGDVCGWWRGRVWLVVSGNV